MEHDLIPYEFLKHLQEDSYLALLHIFNESWSLGSYPDEWKVSHILPFLKPMKDPSGPESFRAIHLLSCLGKIMEKMVHTRLVWWMETYNLHMPTQYGFRPSMGTIDCLLHLDSLIYQAFKAK